MLLFINETFDSYKNHQFRKLILQLFSDWSWISKLVRVLGVPPRDHIFCWKILFMGAYTLEVITIDQTSSNHSAFPNEALKKLLVLLN